MAPPGIFCMKTMSLPATHRELLEIVAAINKPAVKVLTTGSALSFDQTKAMLCWYSGPRGADAVAESLRGESNPAGRLPVTFYQRDGEKVVQVFATAMHPPVRLRKLAGCQRIAFKAGAIRPAAISVPVNRRRRWNESENRPVVDSGANEIMAGPASDRSEV